MLYIIILIIIVLLAWEFIIPLIVLIGVIYVLTVFGLWPYVFGLAAICLVGYTVVYLLGRAGKYVGDQVEQHDKNQREIAQINQKTQADKRMHSNDNALMEELKKNCSWLGYMNEEMWLKKLPNYVNRQYTTDFRTITNNFAKQIEQQYILQNNDWFEPFILYILNHPGGSSVTKMLHEVSCPQLKMTHSTPDGDLINTWLVRGTQKANIDVPALFSSTFIKEMNESVFTPTPYLQKLYGGNNAEDQKVNHTTEMSMEDLEGDDV